MPDSNIFASHNGFSSQASFWIAVAFIVLLAVPSFLPYNIYTADILAAPMLAIVAFQFISDCKARRRPQLPPPLLSAYLAAALIATIIHWRFTVGEFYEWLVFAYVAFLFHFSYNAFGGRKPLLKALAACGGFILIAVQLAFVYEIMSFAFGFRSLFCFFSEQMETTEMAFLSRRFAFTMNNPNVFACFYVLPFALITPFVHQYGWSRHPLKLRLLYFPLCLLLLLPLLSSASKHGLMSLAIMAGWMPPIFGLRRRWLTALLLAGVLAVAAVFELTVLFTTFPPQSSFPFINTMPGMYSVHQGTYAKMICANPSFLPFGMGITKTKEEYPKFADHALAESVLQRYNAMPSYENFITFMDAHNEFLNQMALFGIVPLLLLLAFILSKTRHANTSAILFIAALLCCCLWDDLLSKRHVWIALAIFCKYR